MLAGVSRFGLFNCFRRAPLFNGAPKCNSYTTQFSFPNFSKSRTLKS